MLVLQSIFYSGVLKIRLLPLFCILHLEMNLASLEFDITRPNLWNWILKPIFEEAKNEPAFTQSMARDLAI